MNVQNKWLLATILALFVVLFLSGSALASESGTCGANLTWTLDDEGVLTIEGTGYLYQDGSEWEEAVIAVVGEGVTGISSFTFSGCSKLTSITIPDSVTRACF